MLGDAGSNPVRGNGSLSLVSVVCCQGEVSAMGRSLDQGSPTDCGVSERDRDSSIMRGPWTTRECYAIEWEKILSYSLGFNYIVVHSLIMAYECRNVLR